MRPFAAFVARPPPFVEFGLALSSSYLVWFVRQGGSMRSIRLGLVLAVLSWAPVTLLAQQGTAQMSGKVTDEQGAVLPGVAVLVTNEDTGVYREVVSSQSGSYFVGQLVPGRYKVSAKLEGFAPLDRTGLVLQVGNTIL